jgi:hypothetical protein
MGGLALKTLKKLKGAKFGFPSLSIVLAKQIGLGPTAPSKYLWIVGISRSDKFKVSMFINKGRLLANYCKVLYC